MNTDPSPPEITVETEPTTVAEPAEAVDPGDNPTKDIQDTELKTTTGSDSGDLDIKMD